MFRDARDPPQAAAYSTQSDKVINSGEGGFVTTSDDEIAARIIFLSGAYERRYCEERAFFDPDTFVSCVYIASDGEGSKAVSRASRDRHGRY